MLLLAMVTSNAGKPIVIAEYDASWPMRFEAERALMYATCGRDAFTVIEHVGSTAVPELAAKPIIDIMPGLRSLDDAPAAIEFLCKAFGFAKKMVVEGDGGMIAHAELTLGNAMVMLGSHKETEYGKLVKTPNEVGICTQTIYLVVANHDAHHDKAKAAGAEIVIPLTTQDYGGWDYTCRDPEGHIWTFGTYDPWKS